MRIRQAKKIIEAAAHGQLPPVSRVIRALRTVWHRSRHENGKRMGGSLRDRQLKTISLVLTGRLKVNLYGVPINEA